MALINDAVGAGASVDRACATVGISTRTYQRWQHAPELEDGRHGPRTPSKHKLSAEEEQAILKLVNEPPYRNLTPEQIVAKVADEGRYLASERSIRRVLRRHRQSTYRNRAKPARHHKPRRFAASGPLQVLTWDITYMSHSRIRGGYFFLYLFIDIWSRRIVGFAVHEEQNAELAAELLRSVCAEHRIEAANTVLHADNGAPMKGATMLATMHALGIVKSFSRPGVSDDNAFVEAVFRHLKYVPSYPTHGFGSLDEARTWVTRFVEWYNHHHLHSAIGYVTPADRDAGRDIDLLENRRRVYEHARRRNPLRWTRRPRPWSRPATVILNPDRLVHTTPTAADHAA
jgi:putative transposase